MAIETREQGGICVFSADPRITQLGFLPFQNLPQMEFETMYKRDKKTRLELTERHDPFDL